MQNGSKIEQMTFYLANVGSTMSDLNGGNLFLQQDGNLAQYVNIWRRFVMKAYFALACLTVLGLNASNQVFAQTSAVQACTAVYRGNTTNLMSKSVEQAEALYYFNMLCSQSDSGLNKTVASSFKFPIEGVPISLSFDGSLSRDEAEAMCNSTIEERLQAYAATTTELTAANDALANFNQCVAIASNNLVISHTFGPPHGVIIDGRFEGTPLAISLNNVLYEETLLDCSSTSFSNDGRNRKVDINRAYKIPSSGFSIACTRKAETLDPKNNYYPETVIALSTGAASYQVKLHDERLMGFSLASRARSLTDDLASRLTLERTKRISAENTVTSWVNRFMSIHTRRVYRGDNPGSVPHNRTVDCKAPDQSDFLAACDTGATVQIVSEGWYVPGGRCGHQTWTVVCAH